ncbi:hypothetical protein I203_100840 [Kwoniella mangroviensis CBS 8507]|uniref:uncharacterized protein n=1 Tax=Kwoniella mangroviensis CBS 8507 TaxID=1296122 RepID=UPI00080CF729|nr:uncharacterized protein I203_02483 [Kwoniella mangroviensis CBS 8507]OCF67827.1 hypothetical protein I203_02483 [Kwoniella mangroviensis CBS 8507]
MYPPRSPDRERDIDRDRDREWNSRSRQGWSNQPPQPTSLPPPHGGWGNNYINNNPYNPGPSSSRRSRSPEGDRSRQNSVGGRSGYRPVDTYLPQSESHEPGQISSPNMNQQPVASVFPPRDPRAPPTGPSNRSAPLQPQPYRPGGPAVRKVSADRPNDGGRSPLPVGPSASGSGSGASSRDVLTPSNGSVMGALDNFSKTMHSALMVTSQHALARKHLERLSTFEHRNPNSVALEEADRRVVKAQKVVDEVMIGLQNSFTELIKRTLGTIGTSSEAISKLELDGLRERMRKIEEQTLISRATEQPIIDQSRHQPPPPPSSSSLPPPSPPPSEEPPRPRTPSAPPPPLPENTESDQDQSATLTREEKKRRVGEVFNSIVDRLDALEDMINGFDSRIDDVETNLLSVENETDEKEIKKDKKKRFATWEDVESRRDPNINRSKKRKQREGEEGEVAGPTTSNSQDDEDIDMAGATGNHQLVEKLQKDIERLSNEVQVLQNQLSNSSGPAIPAPSINNTSTALASVMNRLNPGDKVPTSNAPAAGTASLGAMLQTLNSERQHMITDGNANILIAGPPQLDDLKVEVGKLSEQVKILQTQSSTRKLDGNASSVVNGGQQSNHTFLENTINKLRSDVKVLLDDKESRLGIFEKISSGLNSLADNIQRCKNDYTILNDTQRASAATILLHTENIKIIQNDIKQLRTQSQTQSGITSTNIDMAKDKEIKELKEAVKVLQDGLKEMRQGREEWTKEVMKACLDAVKEENESRKDDYAKIARREIRNTVREFMTKRASSTPGVSSASSSQPSNRSISEPVRDATIGSPAVQPMSISPQPNSTLDPGTSNPLASRINNTAATAVDGLSRPTLSDRITTDQPPTQGLQARFTGGAADGMDIDGN